MISSKRCDGAQRGLGVTAALLVALGSAPARAEPNKGDVVAAEALFKAARALVEAGSWPEGCQKFEASLALNPSASTMLNIARCHEHDGKLATAWGDYNRALVLNHETQGAERRKGLESVARQGVDGLESRLPKLRVVIANPPAGLDVQRDGAALPIAALGEPLPIDPGPHEIRASAPGKKPEARTVTLEEGKTATVEFTLTDVADASAAAGSKRSVPTWVWVTGAGGIALSGVAAVFLAQDLSAISALRENCPVGPVGTFCNSGYDYESDNARKNRSLGLFIGLGSVGVLAMGTAIVGLATSSGSKAPPQAAAAPWIMPGGGGATLVGKF